MSLLNSLFFKRCENLYNVLLLKIKQHTQLHNSDTSKSLMFWSRTQSLLYFIALDERSANKREKIDQFRNKLTNKISRRDTMKKDVMMGGEEVIKYHILHEKFPG